MLKRFLGLCGVMPFLLSSAGAQEVSVPSVTTASPGGYANPLKLDTDRYEREQRAKTRPRGETHPAVPQRQVAQSCSAESVPVAEQRRIADGYMRRVKAEGKARADIWVHEEGVRYRMELVRQGICPEPTAQEMAELEAWRAHTRHDR